MFVIRRSKQAAAHRKLEERRSHLMLKYGDAEVVAKIMSGTIWQGMTSEQIGDCLGDPAEVDEKIYKSKVVHTYKYGRIGKNRFQNRVKLENGIVVGWDVK